MRYQTPKLIRIDVDGKSVPGCLSGTNGKQKKMKYLTPKLEPIHYLDVITCNMGGSVLIPPARCNTGGGGR